MSARQGIHTDDLEAGPATASQVLSAVRLFAGRVASSGDPSAGYDDVRQAVFALAEGRALPTPEPRAAEIFEQAARHPLKPGFATLRSWIASQRDSIVQSINDRPGDAEDLHGRVRVLDAVLRKVAEIDPPEAA